MTVHEDPALKAPRVAMAWMKVVGYGVGLLSVVAIPIAGIAYGHYEMQKNDDLTLQLNASRQQEQVSEQTIKSLRDQMWDLKQQTLTCKTVASNGDQWKQLYGTCAEDLKVYQRNGELLGYIASLNSQIRSVQSDIEITRSQDETRIPVPSGDAARIIDLEKQLSILEGRVNDAQKRLICTTQ